jgi:indole-3-glycerol phosphate synthase
MTILDRIVEHKKIEVHNCKELIPVAQLEKAPFFNRDTCSLKASLMNPDRTGIIAEFKRKSPSKGIINNSSSVEDVTSGFARGGASALSVLTDVDFFGGSNDDLIKSRNVNQIPILRTDFTITNWASRFCWKFITPMS